jgi:hypothetical protein
LEKRSGTRRVKKRITVRFGEDAAERVAFTEDISRAGIFIKSAKIIAPGKPVRVEFELDSGTVKIVGTVAWARKVPPNMIRLVQKCGMGVRISSFLEGEEAYQQLHPDDDE